MSGAVRHAPPRELPRIARHAASVFAGQIAVMGFGVADTVVAGRHSEAALAALSVGSAIFVSVYIALMGIFQALLPVWAELHGARREAQVGRSVRQSLYLCAAACVLGMAALMSPGPLLRWSQVPPELQAQVRAYLHVLAFGLPPALLFRIYSTLNQSLGRPLLVTWLQLGSLALKVPLSAVLALGALGLPALGARGCAWATVLVEWATLAVAVYLTRTQPFYAPYRLWQRMETPDSRQLLAFLRLGVPAGLALLVEGTAFTLMALFIARQGTTAAAAHQVAASVAALLYMAPLSIAIATSARVGWWLGARDAVAARHAVRVGLLITLVAALAQAAAIWAGRTGVAPLFTREPAVAAGAAALLAWVAVFHLGDALQCFCVFVLRCYRITVAPLAVYCVLLWGLGLGGGYWWAYHGGAGLAPWRSPAAFWAAGGVALGLTAAVFLLLVARAVRRGPRS